MSKPDDGEVRYGARNILTAACKMYDDWYLGGDGSSASSIAFDLVTSIRLALHEMGDEPPSSDKSDNTQP